MSRNSRFGLAILFGFLSFCFATFALFIYLGSAESSGRGYVRSLTVFVILFVVSASQTVRNLVHAFKPVPRDGRSASAFVVKEQVTLRGDTPDEKLAHLTKSRNDQK